MLNHFIKLLFYSTALALVLALGLVDVIAFAKAGRLEMPALTAQALGSFSGLSVGGVAFAVPPSAHAAATSLAASSLFSQAAEESTMHWLLGGVAATALTLGVVLSLCAVWAKVDHSLEICRSASRTVSQNGGLLLLPLLSAALSLAILGYFGAVVIHILTPDPETIAATIDAISEDLALQSVALTERAADAVAGATASAISNVNQLAQEQLGDEDGLIQLDVGGIDLDDAAEALALNVTSLLAPSSVAAAAIGYEAAVCLWLLLFVDGLVYCTIAGAVAHSIEGREAGAGALASLCRLARYHLGSVALGSAVLGLLSGLRAVLLYVERRSAAPHSATATPLTQYLLRCCQCCLWCFDHCLRYLTRFAYVYVAAEGQPFCAAAVSTFALLSAHPLQLMTNEAALTVLSLLLSLLTPLGCALLGYFAVLRQWRDLLLSSATAVDAPDSLGEWSEGLVSTAAVANASAAMDALFDSAVTTFDASLPDWSASGPPSAFNVALAAFAVSFCITQMFRRVYAATVDTLWVCVFFQESEAAMLAARGRR